LHSKNCGQFALALHAHLAWWLTNYQFHCFAYRLDLGHQVLPSSRHVSKSLMLPRLPINSAAPDDEAEIAPFISQPAFGSTR
jgi:hypothetical protein